MHVILEHYPLHGARSVLEAVPSCAVTLFTLTPTQFCFLAHASFRGRVASSIAPRKCIMSTHRQNTAEV